jgi:hypothetical protein
MDVSVERPAPYAKYRAPSGVAPYPSAPPYPSASPYASAPLNPDDGDDTGNLSGDLYPGQALILARERARREHSGRHDGGHGRPSPSHSSSGARNFR